MGKIVSFKELRRLENLVKRSRTSWCRDVNNGIKKADYEEKSKLYSEYRIECMESESMVVEKRYIREILNAFEY